MSATYDIIGVDYANLRKADARIAAHIHAALGDAKTVLNVGAGAGNYEPTDRSVTAVEPSAEMIAQRPPHLGPAVQASADSLPFEDKSFDASMAILTIHHWPDKAKGLAEMRRVTRGSIVLLTFDPSHRGCWLTDYLPRWQPSTRGKCPASTNIKIGLGLSPSQTFRCRMIAQTDFSMLIGGDRRPISTRLSGKACRPSGKSKARIRL
jgi:ubiquinone/menaquinone biosynthesis C-methylase UbiE